MGTVSFSSNPYQRTTSFNSLNEEKVQLSKKSYLSLRNIALCVSGIAAAYFLGKALLQTTPPQGTPDPLPSSDDPVIPPDPYENYHSVGRSISDQVRAVCNRLPNPTGHDLDPKVLVSNTNYYSTYDILFMGDFLNGFGCQYNTNLGQVYAGSFKDAKYNGPGTFYHKDGNRLIYEGPFKNGKYDGQGGTLYTEEGRIQFQGGFHAGEFHNKGTLYDENGVLYDGDFQRGKYDDQGTLYLEGGSYYIGKFQNGVYNGYGKLRLGLAEGGKYTEEYDGAFLNSKYHGKGELRKSDGTQYNGAFVNGIYHGHGTLTDSTYQYTGNFVNGKLHGKISVVYLKDGTEKIVLYNMGVVVT